MTGVGQKTRILRFGHTPDPDDAYMFYGFATGQTRIPGCEIEHVLEDIESLNRRARNAEIEVTAISAAMLPELDNRYWIMPMGASVGRDYGPIVAKRAGAAPAGRRIGIPGKNTTAFLLLRLYAKGYEPVEMKFDEIPAAVLRGDLDYGVLIHEAQLTYGDLGLEKLIDLGQAWMADTGLPIPLGLDVVRKDLGRDLAVSIAKALRASIEVANAQRDKAIDYALRYGRGLKKNLGDRFVGMYVNADTLDLGAEGEKALHVLFEKARAEGLVSAPVPIDVLRW